MASAGPGGTIELRYDSPTGPLLGKTAMITPTGNWQTYKNVSLPLTGVPAGTHELFVITRNPGQTASLLNLNWIDFVGKGAAQTAAPDVTATATPLTGAAPLPVAFTPRRPIRTAARSPTRGTSASPARRRTRRRCPSPTLHLRQPGQLHGHADRHRRPGRHDRSRRSRSASPRPRAAARNYRDDFDGTDLGAGWDVVRRDQGLVVSRRDAEDPDRPGRRLRRRQQRQEHRPARGSGRAVDDHRQDQARRQPPVPPGGPDRLRRRRQLHEVRSPGRQLAGQPGDRALRVHQRGRRHAAQHVGGLGAAARRRPTRPTSS